MARHTIKVEEVKARANTMLAAPDSTPEARAAIATLLESVLFATDQYGGFKYQISEWNEPALWDTEGMLKKDYDDTRRVYY